VSQTLPSEEADFDFSLVQPIAVCGCVVNGETVSEIGALVRTKVVCQSLAAVEVEMVHDEMNGWGQWIAGDDSIEDVCQL
jgi:hypothetical protein